MKPTPTTTRELPPEKKQSIVVFVDAFDLYEMTRSILETCGAAEWESPEAGQPRDRLYFLPGAVGETPVWVLGPPEDEDRAVVLDTVMAAELIVGHLDRWLAARGWQVQMSIRRGKCTWRLADCVSPAEGGGDRLDAEYPAGDDLLAVLCASVNVVNDT